MNKPLLLTLALLTSCQFCRDIWAQKPQNHDDTITHEETWTIRGRSISILKTTIANDNTFSVWAYIDHKPDSKNENDIAVAKDIASYSVEKGYFENATKFNVIRRIHVDLLGVAIALIYLPDKKSQPIFAIYYFTMKDLNYLNKPFPPFPMPISFSEINHQILRDKLLLACAENDFNEFFNFLLKQSDQNNGLVGSFKNPITNVLKISQHLLPQPSDFIIYLGELDGAKIYCYIFPLVVIPIKYPQRAVPLFIRIRFRDTLPLYSITLADLFVEEPDDHLLFSENN